MQIRTTFLKRQESNLWGLGLWVEFFRSCTNSSVQERKIVIMELLKINKIGLARWLSQLRYLPGSLMTRVQSQAPCGGRREGLPESRPLTSAHVLWYTAFVTCHPCWGGFK